VCEADFSSEITAWDFAHHPDCSLDCGGGFAVHPRD
jgi:hypothetical protein